MCVTTSSKATCNLVLLKVVANTGCATCNRHPDLQVHCQMQLDLPPPKSGQFLEISFRKLLKNCYDIAGGKTPVGKKELVAWRSSPLFHHVRPHSRVLCTSRCRVWRPQTNRILLAHLTRCCSWPQYVGTLSEQLEQLQHSPDRCAWHDVRHGENNAATNSRDTVFVIGVQG